MSQLALGLLLACAAAVLYDLAIALQALDAREQPAEHGLRPALLRRLVRRPRWLAATIMGVMGWPVQVAALLFAPLTVVQPALAAGLLLLLAVGSRMLDEPIGLREIVATLAIVGGIAGLAWASPENTHSDASALRVAAALMVVALAALVPYALAARRSRAPATGTGPDPGSLAIVLSAGFAFAWTGLASKLLADNLHHHAFGSALAWTVGIGVAALVGLLSEMTALQRRPATQVAPIVFVVQVVIPVVLSPVIGQTWSTAPAGGAAIPPFLLLVAAGAALLASSPPVARLVEAEAEAPVPSPGL